MTLHHYTSYFLLCYCHNASFLIDCLFVRSFSLTYVLLSIFPLLISKNSSIYTSTRFLLPSYVCPFRHSFTLSFPLSAVGVDDAFVIVTTWERINKANMRLPIEERVALTMQHAGVSVTVTSFSDLVAFACGISTVSSLIL